MTGAPLRAISTLRGGGMVVAALVAWNLGNYAFFLVAGRMLGPDDFGLAAALLAAALLIAVPAQGLQFGVARLVAAPPAGDADLAAGLYRKAWRRCGTVTPIVAFTAVVVIVAGKIIGWEIEVGPLITTVLIVAPFGFFFLALGRLQGSQRFGAFSVCFALWGVPRAVALVPLAALGLGVYAALGATGAALLAALALALWFGRGLPAGRQPSPVEWRAFIVPLAPVAVGLSGLAVLINLDVIVARVSLSANAAGQFAAAATLAKAVLVVPQAVSFVVLPRVAARSAAARDTGMLLGLGVAVTLVVGAFASIVLWLLAEPLLRVTYGDGFTASAGLLGAYGFACTLVGALIVVINHHVGRSADRFVWGMAGIAVLQAVLFFAFHGTENAIVAVDALIGVSGLVLHEWMFFGTKEAIVPGIARAMRRGIKAG